MSVTPDQSPATTPSRPRPPRTSRVIRLAARRLLPPVAGIAVLVAAAYIYFGPGIAGLPHALVVASPTAFPLVRSGLETQPDAPATAPAAASDGAQPATPAAGQPTVQPLPTPRAYTSPGRSATARDAQRDPGAGPGRAADSVSVDMIRNLFQGLLVADETGALRAPVRRAGRCRATG